MPNDHCLAHLSHGRITVRHAVTGLAEAAVRFGDGTADMFEAVIAVTGFYVKCPKPLGSAEPVASMRPGHCGHPAQSYEVYE